MNTLHLLDEAFAKWTPEDRQLATTIAADWTQLQVRQLAGEDVNSELAHLTAQIASIRAAETVTATEAFANWWTLVGRAGVRLLIGGLE